MTSFAFRKGLTFRDTTEKVDKAALRNDGVIYTGKHHGEAFEKMNEPYMSGRKPPPKDPDDYEEGFTTTSGRFVDRKEANSIAERNSQKRKRDPRPADVRAAWEWEYGHDSLAGEQLKGGNKKRY